VLALRRDRPGRRLVLRQVRLYASPAGEPLGPHGAEPPGADLPSVAPRLVPAGPRGSGHPATLGTSLRTARGVRGPVLLRTGRRRTDPGAAEREVLPVLRDADRKRSGLLPGLPTAAGMRGGGRKGRRTPLMVQIAGERIADLFALARKEAADGRAELADRYVTLARRIGMRYNVRLAREYSSLYCRGCSRFWVEGITVRTRLRGGFRVRTCLACGRRRRTPYGRPLPTASPASEGDRRRPSPPNTLPAPPGRAPRTP
jgi:ribonuclease P protein subunit RPR2